MRLFFVLICLMACADKSKEAKSIINVGILKQRIAILSSDEFAGRAPATKGGELARDYIVDTYKKLGFSSINNSYTQDLDLVKYRKNRVKSFMSIKSGKNDLAINIETGENSQFTYWSSSLNLMDRIENTEIIFVGYGVTAPEYNWDDFKDADLKGKILLFLNNDPQIKDEKGNLDSNYFGGEKRTYYGRWTYKFEQAKKMGAVGAIIIHTNQSAGYGFNVLGDSGLEDHFTIDLAGSGFLLPFMAHADSSLSNSFAGHINKRLPELFEMANSKEFVPVKLNLFLTAEIYTEINKVRTQNIYAKIEGQDPELKEEHIVLSAHYDHKGVGNGETDSIFNGAWDNASGTASIISLGQALKHMKLKRSIILLACAAEESGTLGSQFFVEQSPLPLKQIIANINIDMPTVHGLSRNMNVVGVNSNSLGNDLKAIANQIILEGKPLQVNDDPNPNAGLFYRSDQVHFAKKGIPALFVMSGSDFIGRDKNFLTIKENQVYHQLSDEMDSDWDLNGLSRDLHILFDLIIKVANDTSRIVWHDGNEFEDEYRILYD